MNRKQIRTRKFEIEARILPMARRVVTLFDEYNELRAQIEKLNGDDPKRETLHFEAAQKLLERQKTEKEYEDMLKEHERLSTSSVLNRISNGQKVRDGKADSLNRNIPPAGLHST